MFNNFNFTATMTTTKTTGATAETRALDKFAELMIKKIESVSADWKKPWFTNGSSTMPRNLDGREYNGMNTIMLFIYCEDKGYNVPVFATFDRIEKLNDKGTPKEQQVHVKKGEKSFPVFLTTFAYFNKETKEYIKWSEYQGLSEADKADIVRYPRTQVYYVFNVAAQTNIQEARPELFEKYCDIKHVEPQDTDGYFELPVMDRMIAEQSWICPINIIHQDEAFYSIHKDAITFPEKKQFKSGESFYSNLFHEMAHSTGSEKCLKRIVPARFGTAEYANEELVAELTAALVSSRNGIDKCIKEDSAAYLKNWLTSLKADSSYIKNILTDVKKASALIEKKLNEVKEQMNNTNCKAA